MIGRILSTDPIGHHTAGGCLTDNMEPLEFWEGMEEGRLLRIIHVVKDVLGEGVLNLGRVGNDEVIGGENLVLQ